MTKMQRMFAAITADSDQDHAHFEKWWDEATEDDKVAVWLQICKKYDDPLMEIMSRMAQIAFTDMVIAKDKVP